LIQGSRISINPRFAKALRSFLSPFCDVVINLQLLAKMAYRPNPGSRVTLYKRNMGEWILDWEVVAIILLGSAAIGGIAYLLGEYRSMRDLDDWS